MTASVKMFDWCESSLRIKLQNLLKKLDNFALVQRLTLLNEHKIAGAFRNTRVGMMPYHRYLIYCTFMEILIVSSFLG